MISVDIDPERDKLLIIGDGIHGQRVKGIGIAVDVKWQAIVLLLTLGFALGFFAGILVAAIRS